MDGISISIIEVSRRTTKKDRIWKKRGNYVKLKDISLERKRIKASNRLLKVFYFLY